MASVDNLDDPSDIDEFLLDRAQAAPHIVMLGQSAREITSHVSGGLATWVSRLTISPHRQHIKGTASSSKTQLSLQELGNAAHNGQQALYFCYNRPLADAVNSVAPTSVTVITIHEIARALGEQNSQKFDIATPGELDRMAGERVTLSPQLQKCW